MKRKTTKELLADSLRELAIGKNIDRITVRDIVENCGYSTATFYRHFNDKYDLIAWDYTREIKQILDRVDGSHTTWMQAFTDAAAYYEENRNYLKNLLLHTAGYDSFFRYMTEINCDSLKERICLTRGDDAMDEKTEMFIRLYCFGAVGFTCEWILGKYSVSYEELPGVYESSLPEILKAYLC